MEGPEIQTWAVRREKTVRGEVMNLEGLREQSVQRDETGQYKKMKLYGSMLCSGYTFSVLAF